MAVGLDRAPDPSTSRKMGTYYMANLLFKVYFKLNSTSLCKNLTNGIKHSELAPFESFPASHRVSTARPKRSAASSRARS